MWPVRQRRGRWHGHGPGRGHGGDGRVGAWHRARALGASPKLRRAAIGLCRRADQSAMATQAVQWRSPDSSGPPGAWQALSTGHLWLHRYRNGWRVPHQRHKKPGPCGGSGRRVFAFGHGRGPVGLVFSGAAGQRRADTRLRHARWRSRRRAASAPCASHTGRTPRPYGLGTCGRHRHRCLVCPSSGRHGQDLGHDGGIHEHPQTVWCDLV